MGFCGLERAGGPDATGPGIFWLHVAGFTAYSGVVGYVLLHREARGAAGLALFVLAIGSHLVVNDFGLRGHHKRAYGRLGRWVMAAAVLGGWARGHSRGAARRRSWRSWPSRLAG